MLRTLKDISTFSVLLFIFIFIYTLLGLEVFAFQAKFNSNDQLDLKNGEAPEINFDGFIQSFSTVFIVLTNDSWSTIFFDYYRACGAAISVFFFVTLILFGQKILLNLYLAILLENFDEASLNEEIKDKIKKKRAQKNQPNVFRRGWNRVKSCCLCSTVVPDS